MQHSPSGWAPLQPILQEILLAHSDGLSEFELFGLLKSPPFELFSTDALQNPLSLFQSHFIVFNALYQLRDNWLHNQIGSIEIHCTCIRKLPWEAGIGGIIEQDNLRVYYLDWANLNDTDQAQVEALLDSFWDRFSGISNQSQNNDMPIQQAIKLLDLTQPFSAQQLKQQYRRMLHKHHPDKGGSHGTTVEIHKAYQCLKNGI